MFAKDIYVNAWNYCSVPINRPAHSLGRGIDSIERDQKVLVFSRAVDRTCMKEPVNETNQAQLVFSPK